MRPAVAALALFAHLALNGNAALAQDAARSMTLELPRVISFMRILLRRKKMPVNCEYKVGSTLFQVGSKVLGPPSISSCPSRHDIVSQKLPAERIG